METKSQQIGLDSQCLSFLIDIMGSTSRLSEGVSEQQLSLLRIYLYAVKTFWVTPQVQSECLAIPDEEYREKHGNFMNTLFGVLPPSNFEDVEENAAAFFVKHNRWKDCRVLAEALDVGHYCLLTFDHTFIKRLSGVANVKLAFPSDYWRSLEIQPGSTPVTIPAAGNPLSEQDFWRW